MRVANALSILYCAKFCHALRSQHRDQMTELIFNIAGNRNRVGDLLAQQGLIMMTEPMEGLPHSIIRHVQLSSDLRPRWRSRLVRQQLFQAIKQLGIACCLVFVLQSPQYLIHQRQSPATFVKSVSSERVGRLHPELLGCGKFLQRHRPLSFASLGGHRPTVFAGEEMLQRGQKIRAQPPFIFANRIEIATLEEQRKKTLGKIFGLLRSCTLSPDEAINRSPVGAA